MVEWKRFCASTLVWSSVFLSGCVAGPDFSPPPSPDISAYGYDALPGMAARGSTSLAAGEDIPAQWWTLFHSKTLNALIDRAVRENPDLASAEVALRRARTNVSLGEAAFIPTLSGSVSSSSSPSVPLYTLRDASVAVSYSLDTWGGVHRSVESLKKKVKDAHFLRDAACLMLTGNVVTQTATEASLQAQIAAAREIVAAREKLLGLALLRLKTGAFPQSAVTDSRASLEKARAALTGLQHRLVVTRHALSALTGRSLEKTIGPTFWLKDEASPKSIPSSLPSELVAQRPDVRAARAAVEETGAILGAADVATLPSFVLTAETGSVESLLKKADEPESGIWNQKGSLAKTLLGPGHTTGRNLAAWDAFDRAARRYRKTVLSALQEVADTLHALKVDDQTLETRQTARRAAEEALREAQTRFDTSAVGWETLLAAKQTMQKARADESSALAQRYADTAALFVALGGGWWSR
ncbi:MAG: efflux transporter outer membrane subunit [Alphaproteobacteria bacterium]|nr:efflux transporter outer membrane subunit [Alphaproteobacteria bacterium]